MKKFFDALRNSPQSFLLAAACALLIVCLVKISALENQVVGLQYQVSGQIQSLDANVASISSQVRQAMEEEASLLTQSDWSYGEPDWEALTVPFTYTVVPKTHTPGVTTAVLAAGKNTYPMTDRGNGMFTVTLDWPIFKGFAAQRVIFETNGVQSVESVDLWEEPLPSILTLPTVHCPLTTWYERETLYYDGDLNLDNCVQAADATLELVVLENGKETDHQPLTPDSTSYNYISAHVEGSVTLSDEVKGILCVDLTDANGLRYRLPILGLTPLGEEALYTQENIEVYSPQGELLWRGWQ